MPRSYRKIQQYEKEILELKEEGLSNREICKRFGFEMKQLKNFINRYNTNQRKLAAGIALKKKGRSAKNCVVTNQDKVAELKYALTRKDAKIKQLEMENELMRDFFTLTERK